MKTMRCTSTLGLVLSAAFMALVAALLTAVTQTGASGAYAFLLTGITTYMVFLMWPDRTRFRRQPLNSDSHGRRTGRQGR